MPFYEYEPKCGKCEICGGRFMDLQKISEPAHSECPECGQACERVMSAPQISVRGEGFRKAESAERREQIQSQARQELMRSRAERGAAVGSQNSGHQHNCALHGCFAGTEKASRSVTSEPYLVGSRPKTKLG